MNSMKCGMRDVGAGFIPARMTDKLRFESYAAPSRAEINSAPTPSMTAPTRLKYTRRW